MEFSLSREWQKELIIQGFYYIAQGITDIVEICERLETAEEIFQMQGELNHQSKKQAVWWTPLIRQVGAEKGSNQNANPLEEEVNKKRKK